MPAAGPRRFTLVMLREVFVNTGGLKKGDTIHVDWVPEKGTTIELNGKQLEDPIPEPVFYNALLKIWLGDKPADTGLKPLLLGAKAEAVAASGN